MKYSSSSQTFIFKNIFPLIFLGGGVFAFVMLKTRGEAQSTYFANAFGIALFWLSIFLVQLPFRLKSIETDEHGLFLKSKTDKLLIPYKNVIYVSKFDLASPWMITIKYLDSSRNESRKISYLPNQKHQSFMKDDEMTEYITNRAKLENPDFVESNSLKNLLIVFLAGLPFFIGIIYFMLKAGLYNF